MGTPHNVPDPEPVVEVPEPEPEPVAEPEPEPEDEEDVPVARSAALIEEALNATYGTSSQHSAEEVLR
jgi:hypothetical protein